MGEQYSPQIDTIAPVEPPKEEKIVSPELHELDNNIRDSAAYLERLDVIASGLTVSPSGKISYAPQASTLQSSEKISEYRKILLETFDKFSQINNDYLTELKSDPNTLDAIIINGAVMCTYDSSKGTPSTIQDDSSRGFHKAADVSPFTNKGYLGLIGVDLNVSKRPDKVSPTISAVHELHHHDFFLSNYLMSKDSDIGMASASRRTQRPPLYDKVLREEDAIDADKNKYRLVMERDDVRVPDCYIQSAYLDEFHSSFLQRKQEWLYKNSHVYSGHGRGEHWELVGKDKGDQEATKRFLGLTQAFYILDEAAEYYRKLQARGQQIGPQTAFILQSFPKSFIEAGSLIGTARSVKQAERLLHENFNDIKSKAPDFMQTAYMKERVSAWQASGAAADNLQDLFQS